MITSPARDPPDHKRMNHLDEHSYALFKEIYCIKYISSYFLMFLFGSFQKGTIFF